MEYSPSFGIEWQKSEQACIDGPDITKQIKGLLGLFCFSGREKYCSNA